MKIVTWNCNSVSLRFEILTRLIADESPDIICLQETKVRDDNFPSYFFDSLSFKYQYFWGNGNGQYGVAIISKVPLYNIEKIDVLGYEHARLIMADITPSVKLFNVYIPAGGDIADPMQNPKFDHKLKFLDYFTKMLSEVKTKIVVGDINIAPLDNDVYDHKKLLKVVSHTPVEVERFKVLMRDANLVDAVKSWIGWEKAPNMYTWWSYRVKDSFIKNYGRRLDHVLASPDIIIKDSRILKDYRILERPSDHVPIVATIVL